MAKQLVIGFVVAWFLLDALMASWLKAYPESHLNQSPLTKHQQLFQVLKSSPEVLIFGNSQASLAFQPQQLTERLSETTIYNHSVYVGGLAFPALALKRWLEVHAPPRLILWAISPYELSDKPAMVCLNVSQNLSLTDLSWVLRAGGARWDLLKSVWINSWSSARQDRQRWQAMLTGKSMAQELDLDTFGASRIKAQDISKDEQEVWQKTYDFYHRTITNGFQKGQKASSLIASFEDQCDQLGIHLVIVSLPISSQYSLLYQSGDYDRAFAQLSSVIQKKNISHWDCRDWHFDLDFTDGVHLGAQAISEFSKKIAPKIQQALSP